MIWRDHRQDAAKILTGEADISTMPIEYTDATPKYNPTICEELGIQPLDGYEAIELIQNKRDPITKIWREGAIPSSRCEQGETV